MAQKREFRTYFCQAYSPRAKNCWKILTVLSVIVFAALHLPAAHAQLQQPLVFSSAGAVASRNDQTALTPVGSPFTAANRSLVIEVQGRFLFAIGATSIHRRNGLRWRKHKPRCALVAAGDYAARDIDD